MSLTSLQTFAGNVSRRCRFLVLLAFCLACASGISAQTNEWTWMGGTDYINGNNPTFINGVYGTQGVQSAQNFPATREGPATWTDKAGNLWLFGGYGWGADYTVGYLNDLWKFTPSTNEWTWIAGSDKPGTDNCSLYEYQQNGLEYGNYSCGQPGIYGTQGVAAPANTPGGREHAVAWTDENGRFWLFGGLGYEPGIGQGYFNDLWMLDPSTGQWTWMSGSPTVPAANEGEYGVYGTLGKSAATNYPGGRSDAAGCVDPSGNFWLFGGIGALSNANGAWNLNDLWRYSPYTSQWTWMSGGSTSAAWGIYGNMGIPATTNFPGARTDSACWFDRTGKLWLFGGDGYAAQNVSGSTFGYLNDLWQFNPATGAWGWMAGSNQATTGGVYGTKGVAAEGNIPSARYQAMHWTDSSGRFWLFGGRGVDSRESYGDMNDLWMFDPATKTAEWVTGSNINNYSWFGVAGTYGTLGVPSADNSPGGKDLAAAWTDVHGNLWLFAGEGCDSVGGSWGFGPNDLWKFQLSTAPAKTPTPSISPAAGSYTSSEEVTIKDSDTRATIYYSTNAATTQAFWSIYAGPFPLSASETVTAIAIYPGLSASAAASAAYQVPAATPVIDLPPGTYAAATVQIYDSTPGAVIHFTANKTTPTASSPVYSGQIEVKASETISAIAIAPGSLDSAVATAAYTISSSTPPPTTNQWIWMGGRKTVAVQGVPSGNFGKLGVAASTNLPTARVYSTTWTDLNGNFWLFGGQGYDAAGNEGNLNDLWEFNPAASEWTWIGGSSKIPTNTYRLPGVYGTRGKFAAANIPGGRADASSWVDKQGNFWLFGGSGYDSAGNNTNLNDLWEFSTSLKQWAWIAGPSLTTCPGSAYGGCAQRSDFGAFGAFAPSNTPGGRGYAVSWTDNQGNLWLFGGSGIDSLGLNGELNELWEFDPSIQQWAWVGGSQTVGPNNAQPGIYGEQGIPSSDNYPGGRDVAAGWTDAAGNFWLFGGSGADANDAYGDLNDLWEFNPISFEWTWVSGASSYGTGSRERGITELPGVYGDLGVPGAGNAPGGRFTATAWRDAAGNFWLFGGGGYDGAGNFSYLNDLWAFSPSTNLWTWMGGDSQDLLLIANQNFGVPGAYGILGSAIAGDNPGGRYAPMQWRDKNGNFWLFGGVGFDQDSAFGQLNDMWKFVPAAPAPQAATPTFSLPTGWYTGAQTITISDSTPDAKIYYTTNGATPTTSSTLYTGAIHVTQTTGFEAIAVASGYTGSPVVTEIYIIEP